MKRSSLGKTVNINILKRLFVFLSFIFLMFGGNAVSALDVSQQSLSLTDKSETAIVHDAGIGNLSITPTLEFNRLDDFVSYNLVIRNNDGKKYKIISITDDNTNEAISIAYNYPTELNTDDKSIDFTIKYVKTTQYPLKSINVIIKLVDEDDASEEIPIVVPNTGVNTTLDTVSAATVQTVIMYMIFAAASCSMYIIVRRKKTKQNSKANLKAPRIILTIALLLGIVPVAVIATDYEDLRFIVNLTNVQLNGPYTITFDTEGGSEIPPQIVNNGETITKPSPDPVKNGYDFDGWVDENGDPYDFNTPVTGPVTLSASWKVITYTISYDLAGGTAGTPANPTSYNVETPNFTLTNPTKEHYNFTGWTGTDLTEPTSEVAIAQGSTGDRSYTATWTEKEYTVTYDSDGGTSVPSETKKYNETFTEPTAPTRTGYDFVKWQLNGADYDFNTSATSDITLKAVWEKKDYTVTFNSNGGTSVPTQTVKYQELATEPQDPTKTGYNFQGWQLNDTDYDFSTPVEDNITLDAVWGTIEYTITYTLNGGSVDPANPDTYTVESNSITLTNPTREHYTFIGWTGTGLTDPTDEVTIAQGSTGDRTYTANWAPVEYTIDYDLGGGSVSTTNPTSYTIETSDITLNNPTKTNFEFDGWTGTDLTSPTKNVTIAQGSTGDRSYTANWTELFTVTFDTNGGTPTPNSQTIRDGEYATEPEVPTRNGYEFKGWQLNDADYDFENTPVTANVELKAKWEIIEYTIHYDLFGGTVSTPNPTTYTINDTFTLNNPTLTGHKFKGWSGSDGHNPQLNMTITAGTTGNLHFIAHWAGLATVEYDTNGGDELDPSGKELEEGDPIGALPTPTRNGYDFVGWYVDGDTSETIINENYIVNDDIVIMAKWTPTTYSITYDLAGGTAGTPANPTTYNIETVTFTLTNPTKAGYDFDGWTGSNGSTPQTTVTINQGTTGDLSYTANWTELFTVTFDANGGTPEPTAQIIRDGETTTEPTTPPEKTGYNFAGWQLNGADYDFSTLVTGDITLVAKWTLVDYTISYDLAGGTAGTPANPTSYNVETPNFTLTNPTKEHYNFTGWTGTDLTEPTSEVAIAQGSTGDRSYTATWTEKEYTVTYDSDGGTSVPSETKKYNETFTEPTAPTRTGYDFVKWQLNGADYDFNTSATSDITLKAVWEAIEYTISYNLNGATTDPGNPTTYTIETPTITLINPSKTKYVFKGWTGSNGSTPQTTVTIPQGSTGNKTYEANWNELFTVTYDPNGGTMVSPLTFIVENGEPIGSLVNPSRAHYNFDGWYIGTTKIESTYIVTNDITITAKWTPVDYTITYNLDGGSATNPGTYNIETATFTLNRPTKSGFEFDGWTGSNGTTPELDVTINQGTTGDLTYTANWTELFTVTFNADGGTPTPTPATVRDGDTVAEPTAPTRTDYIFRGWKDASGNDYNFATPITSDLTLTAEWQVEKAELNDWQDFSRKMKNLAGSNIGATSSPYGTTNNNITAFKKATKEQYEAVKSTLTDADNKISSSASKANAYMWFDSTTGTTYWYSEAENIYISGSMERAFANLPNLTDISGLANFDTSDVTDMNRLFQNSKSLSDLSPLANWDTSKVINMTFMFGAGNGTGADKAMAISDLTPLAGWDVSSVVSMYQMFKNCRSITDLTPLKDWIVSGVRPSTEVPSNDDKQFEQMFNYCGGLTDAKMLAGWDVTNAVNFTAMFNNTPDLSTSNMPIFTIRPGTWSDNGTYTPSS